MPVDVTKLDDVIGKIEKKYGKGTVLTGGDYSNIERIPTGSVELDYVTGGGIPIGRWTRFFGGSSSGKSLASWNIIREAQKLGMQCVYYNIEKQFDPVHVKAAGIDMSKLKVVNSQVIEEVSTEAEALFGAAHVHIIDSCSQAISLRELNADPEKEQIAPGTKAWGAAFRRMNKHFDDQENTVIYIDHARVAFGSGSEQPPGGKAMEHMSSCTLHFKRGKWLGLDGHGLLNPDGEMRKSMSGDNDPFGMEMQVRCVKSRVCQPFRTARMRIAFDGYKYDDAYELAKAGKWIGVIKGAGWYEVEGEDKKIQGEGKLRTYIEEHPEFQDKIREAVLAQA